MAACRWFVLPLLVGCLSGCFGPKGHEISEISGEGSDVASAEPLSFAETDWPFWRGPRGDGHAPSQPAATEWNDSTNVAWQSDVPGRGHSSPTVVGERVYLATAIETESRQAVLAYDRATGERLWETTVHTGGLPDDGQIHRKATRANSTVAFAEGSLFASFLNDDHVWVTALDLDGNTIWQRDIGPFSSKFGFAPSPIPYRSLIIVAADNQGGGYLAGLDRASGEIVWRTSRPALSSYSSPLIAEIAGRDQLVICGCHTVTAYDPATGKELWSCDGTAEGTCGTPVTDGTHVFASGGYPQRETLCVKGDGSGEKVWSERTKLYEPSLIVAGDHLYGVTDDGVAMCWSNADGQVVWRERLGGSFSASPVHCDGRIYVPNLEGQTIVFAADPKGFRLLARNALGNDAYASPAICGGEIFLRIGVGNGGDRRERLVKIASAENRSATD